VSGTLLVHLKQTAWREGVAAHAKARAAPAPRGRPGPGPPCFEPVRDPRVVARVVVEPPHAQHQPCEDRTAVRVRHGAQRLMHHLQPGIHTRPLFSST